jgi:hypothetical protein
MKKVLVPAVVAAGLLALSASTQAQQQPGVVGAPPPEDLFLEVTTGPQGQPILSQTEFTLAVGGYYRFNFVCPDAADDTTGFHFEAPGLIQNSHLRVYSVGDIELYIQGAYFHAIECDEAGAARFSFHPMRRGVYDLYVRDHSDPPQEAFARAVVE